MTSPHGDDDSPEFEQRKNDCYCCTCNYAAPEYPSVRAKMQVDPQCRNHGSHGRRACAEHGSVGVRCGFTMCDEPDTCPGNTDDGLRPRLRP